MQHNVGDDFVREGLKYLFRQRFSNNDLKFESIHKHSPITCRYGFEWFRDIRFSRRVDALLPLFLTRDRVLEADMVVQSGAPVYWCHSSHCADNEWYQPLIKRRFAKKKNAKLLNLAAGTCQRYDSDGSEFSACEKDKAYIKDFFSLSSVTTLRDTLAQNVLRHIGLIAPVIPCSSIFAINEHGLKNMGDDYIAVNYMKGGSHYILGQQIDSGKWQKQFSNFYHKLKKRNRIIFACHNEKEVREVQDIDPTAEIFFSVNFLDYMKFYSRARLGILNRVHGAFMMASFGKPSIVVGNDSRAKMAHEIGLKSYFVNDVHSNLLMSECERLESERAHFHAQFDDIKSRAYNDYMDILRPIL